ncbi:hypothetical protein KR093_010223, partial [Drosophila rubida]
MTLVGLAARKLAQKQRSAKLAAAFPNGIRCQKCLNLGHWSYECKEKRKYVHRSSRTKQLSKHLKEKNANSAGTLSVTNETVIAVREKRTKLKRRRSVSSSSSSSSDSSSSSSESSNSDSSNSGDSSDSSDSDDDGSSSDGDSGSSSGSDSDSDASSSSSKSSDSGNEQENNKS